MKTIRFPLWGVIVFLALTLNKNVYAQQEDYFLVKGPKVLPIELGMQPISGVSSKGEYIWGNLFETAYVYSTAKDDYKLWYGDQETNGYEIFYVSDMGDVLIASNKKKGVYKLYHLNLSSPEELIEIPINDKECPNVTLDAVTPDGKYAVGRLYDTNWTIRKLFYVDLTELSEPKIILLDSPKMDFLGKEAQYARPFVITKDGKTIIGTLCSYSGFEAELLVWKRNDGKETFTCSKAINNYLFDLSKPLPGERPNWSDYVTADYETERGKYEQQQKEYNNAVIEWGNRYRDYTRNQNLNQFNIYLSSDEKHVLCYIHTSIINDETGDEVSKGFPLIVNTSDYNCKRIDNAEGVKPMYQSSTGEIFGILPISENYYDTKVITPIHDDSYEIIDILDWLVKKTGKDFHSAFTFSTDASILVTTGIPVFSDDGTTLSFYGYTDREGELYRKTYLQFGKNLLSLIEPNNHECMKTIYNKGILNVGIPQALVYIYNSSGICVGVCLSDTEGFIRMPLIQGVYIAKLAFMGQNFVSKFLAM